MIAVCFRYFSLTADQGRLDVNKEYKENGCLVVPGVLTFVQVEEFRGVLDNYLVDSNTAKEREQPHFRYLSGIAGKTPALGSLNELHRDDKVHTALRREIFGQSKYIYADQSDLHQNKTTPWHRDDRDYWCPDRGGGIKAEIWGESYHIVKVGFLLQDHSNNDYGLRFKLGTHKAERTDGVEVTMHTKATDMVIFDQRIMHGGQVQTPMYHQKFNQHRYLLTYAYGLDNEHTKIHMRGVRRRQEQQMAELEMS